MELHKLANYPTGFGGTVVSPTKICIQYTNVQTKLRINKASGVLLMKTPDSHKALGIRDDGTDIGVLAVGCQLPVLEEVQLGLIAAYKTYANTHSDTYRDHYGKDFLDFLLRMREELDKTIKVAEGK